MAAHNHTDAALLPHESHVFESRKRNIAPNAPWEAIRSFAITPLSRLSDDVIVLPENWMPAGISQAPSKRRLNVLDFIPNGMERAVCAYHEQQIRRIIFALLMVPRHTQTGVRSLGPNSWITRCRKLFRAARWSLQHRYDSSSLFAHLSMADLADIAIEIGPAYVRAINQDLLYFKARGLINDIPNIAAETVAQTNPEQSYRGLTSAQSDKPITSRQTQPFTDAFISEFIPQCLFISQQLGPPLLRAYTALSDYRQWGLCSGEGIRNRRLTLMQHLDWRLGDGSTITEMPFPVKLRCDGSNRHFSTEWPPRSWTALRDLVRFIQCANYHIVAFCTGALWSEHAAAEIDCINEYKDGRFSSRTYKLAGVVGGVQRTWPLPPQAVNALKIQQQLARTVAGSDVPHLWVKFKKTLDAESGARVFHMNENSEHFVRALGLEHLLEGIRPHDHRWRASMARLGAMSLIEAPRVLMYLFGHRDLEMTLRYILCNDAIRQELEEVYHAAAYALSKDLIHNAQTFSGPAAPRLQSMIESITSDQSGELPMAETLEDVISLLNITGPAARTVRPNIECIKQDGQFAPCSKGHGHPNPARCKVGCEHRLEHRDGRDEAHATIEFLVRELETKDVQEQPLVLAALQGQLLTHLRRFPDVRDFWLNNSGTANDVWQASTVEEMSA
jgi:integrase